MCLCLYGIFTCAQPSRPDFRFSIATLKWDLFENEVTYGSFDPLLNWNSPLHTAMGWEKRGKLNGTKVRTKESFPNSFTGTQCDGMKTNVRRRKKIKFQKFGIEREREAYHLLYFQVSNRNVLVFFLHFSFALNDESVGRLVGRWLGRLFEWRTVFHRLTEQELLIFSVNFADLFVFVCFNRIRFSFSPFSCFGMEFFHS